MFNKSEIMKEAWAHYRHMHETYAAWQFERGIHDGSFSAALKIAWARAKSRKAEAARKAAEASNPRVVALRAAIHDLQYRGFACNIRRERNQLEAEIDAIMKQAA